MKKIIMLLLTGLLLAQTVFAYEAKISRVRNSGDCSILTVEVIGETESKAIDVYITPAESKSDDLIKAKIADEIKQYVLGVENLKSVSGYDGKTYSISIGTNDITIKEVTE